MSRCDYCAFATWTDRHHLRHAYVDACVAHVQSVQAGEGWPEAAEAATLYLGGGTPSELETADLARLLRAVRRRPGAEVTVEANPEGVTDAWAAAVVEAGATRVSLGVQSLDPVVLEGLGRRHDPAAVARAVAALAKAGISSFSVDLIYGGAGETDSSWLATLEGVLALEPAPSHVSAYALTVEAGTPLWRDPGRHPDDDVQAARYELADEVLAAAGYEWYELSNWARHGEECLHNLNYWAQGDYLAIGAAAHGHRGGKRWWNLRTPERYAKAVSDGRSPVAVATTLPEAERDVERLELALRTRAGVPHACLPADDEALAGLLEPAPDDHVRLSRRGRLLANEVACRLRPAAT